MLKPFTDLLYWKWRTAFFNAVKPREVYEKRRLCQKLDKVLFFETQEAKIAPSYLFWVRVYETLIHLPYGIGPETLDEELKQFAEFEEVYLKNRLLAVLNCFKNFPVVFRDLYTYYPQFNLKFEEIEFIYLDYWSQTPKVIASLLSELLVRDMPFRTVYEVPNILGCKALPPVEAGVYSSQHIYQYLIEYFRDLGDDFVKVINLYLNARPTILAECKAGLLASGNVVNDEFLVQYFVGYYIFKGISNEALRFCATNVDKIDQDPFKVQREAFIRKWESYSQELREWFISRNTKCLEKSRKMLVDAALKPHEEKVAIKKAFLKELDDPELDYNKGILK